MNNICAFQRYLRENPPAKRIHDKAIRNNNDGIFRKNTSCFWEAKDDKNEVRNRFINAISYKKSFPIHKFRNFALPNQTTCLIKKISIAKRI